MHAEKPPTDEARPPQPTYAPIAMAMGISIVAWGTMGLTLNIHALWGMSLAGVGLSAWALKRWIGEIVSQWDTAP